MITLNQILARLTIDYDSIIFWHCGDTVTYNDLVLNYDLDHCFLYNMFIDPFGILNIDFCK